MITHLNLYDYPKVPLAFYQDFLDQPIDTVPKDQAVNYTYANPDYRTRITNRYGEMLKGKTQFRISMGEEFAQWVKNAFGPEDADQWYMDSGFTFLIGEDGNETICAPHTDTRQYNLYYLVNRGGDDVTTNYWIEKNKPVARESLITIGNYDDLNLLDAVQFPLNTWVLMNSRIIHSVENIAGDRKSIQVSLNCLPNTLKEMVGEK